MSLESFYLEGTGDKCVKCGPTPSFTSLKSFWFNYKIEKREVAVFETWESQEMTVNRPSPPPPPFSPVVGGFFGFLWNNLHQEGSQDVWERGVVLLLLGCC